jgi:hypothetical protein
MNQQTFQKNLYFYYDLSKWRADPKSIYGIHLENVLVKLEKILGEEYHRFRFLVYEHQMHLPIPDFKMYGKDVILIMLSDENSTVPTELCDKFYAILKSYYPLENNTNNIIAFPIGYSNSASLTRFIPFENRTYDASYAGNFLGNRLDFYRQFNFLRLLPPFPIKNRLLRTYYYKILTKLKLYRPKMYHNTYGNSICYWSGGFAKGLAREEYANIISNTRIALCPMGFRSTECFRLMETMRLGCVIVSDELPPSRWYKNSPIIIVKDWLNISKVLDGLINDPERLLKLHQQTLNWWKDVCSDEAVAAYLASEIRRLSQDA